MPLNTRPDPWTHFSGEDGGAGRGERADRTERPAPRARQSRRARWHRRSRCRACSIRSSPSGNKPTENKKSSSPNKPSENKNSVDDPTANKNTPPNAQTPQGQLPQSAGAQQGSPNRAVPQVRRQRVERVHRKGSSRVQTSPPWSPRYAPGTSAAVGSNPSVRPTPSTLKLTPAQQAGLRNATARLAAERELLAVEASARTPPPRTKGGITPSGTGSSTSNGTSGARGPMGTMMGGRRSWCRRAGHRTPEGEVKSRDPRMQGEDIASQAIGGVYRDGPADGAPTPPAVPGAPTPPTPPTPTAR